MSSISGWARLTVVFVVIVEIVLLAGSFNAWTELTAAKQQLASLVVPPPGDSNQTLDEYFDEVASSSSADIIQRSTEDSARRDYEYAAATVETKTDYLYLFIGSLLVFPLVIALIYQTLFWVGRGFRRQPA